MTWLALLTNKWTWVAIGAVGAVALATLLIHNFGVERYNQGVMAERAAWTQIMNEAVAERQRLRAGFDADRAKWEAETSHLRNRLTQSLRQTQEQIADAETVEDIYAAYRAHSDSVRNDSAERVARARADYLSSLDTDGHRRAPSDQRKPAVADVARSGTGSRFKGGVVGLGAGQRSADPG